MSLVLRNGYRENMALSIIGDSVGVFMPGIKLAGIMFIPIEKILATSISFYILRRGLKLNYENKKHINHKLILSDLFGFIEINFSALGLLS